MSYENKVRDKEELKRQRAEVKLQKEKEKLLRQNEKLQKRAFKPGECHKYIIARIDSNLLEIAEGSEIVSRLLSLDIRYEVVNGVAYSVTFGREDCLTQKVTIEKELIVIIPVTNFLSLVYYQLYGTPSSKSLSDFCLECKNHQPGNRLSLVVCGLDEFLKKNTSTKRKKGQNVKSSQKVDGDINFYLSHLSRIDIETALVMIQVDFDVTTRLFPTPAKIADYIGQIAKAVAEEPHRLDKASNEFTWYAEGSNNNCVKVDKNGEGLLKLWQQQLQQFINVGPETVSAITLEYPSPQCLIKAYRELPEDEAANLLSNIQVRRGVGVLSNTRRVGIELSKRIHKFFTESNPEICL